MSRIFDALQRSGVEQSGIEYPDLISVVTEVFEVKEAPSAAPVSVEQLAGLDLPSIDIVAEAIVAKESIEKVSSGELPDFPAININLKESSRLVFFTEPDSLAAEKMRFLGVRLRQMQQTRALKKVLVTSSIPAEGKSFVSANLAGVLARRKQRVLLVDGDLRRPSLAQQLGLGSIPGLGEWLQGDHTSVGNIYRLEGPNFFMMPAGMPPANPLELMQSGSLSQLMSQLATMFDWIIVDSPPLQPLADTTVWARMTDGILLVTRQGVTQKALLQRGLDTIKKSELLGVVMNGCTDSNVNSYYQAYAGKVATTGIRNK